MTEIFLHAEEITGISCPCSHVGLIDGNVACAPPSTKQIVSHQNERQTSAVTSCMLSHKLGGGSPRGRTQ